MKNEKLTPNDPRLTALACGEISDAGEVAALRAEIENSPELRYEFEAVEKLQAALTQEFRAELDARENAFAAGGGGGAQNIVSFDKAKTVTGDALRKRAGSGVGAVSQRTEKPVSAGEKMLRFALAGGIGLGAAAAFIFAFRIQETTTSVPVAKKSPPATVHSGEVPVQFTGVKAKGETPAATVLARPVKPQRPDFSEKNSFAEIASKMPVRVPGGGENVFEKTSASRTAPLLLAGTDAAYARQLRAQLVAGKMPDRKALRIDGLVNSMLAFAPKANAPALDIEVEIVPAPWAMQHRFARVTIRAGGADAGEVIGKEAVASIAFNPEAVAAWRMLGGEDGDAGAVAMASPGEIRAGRAYTTLFELIPTANAKTADDVCTVKIAYRMPAGEPMEAAHKAILPAAGSIESASEEMRFAAAIASFGLALRDSQFKGEASPGLAARLAGNVQNENRVLFNELLREAASVNAVSSFRNWKTITELPK